jgi:hypothetical protein
VIFYTSRITLLPSIVKILENKKQWSANYRNGWLAYLQETGEIDWSLYEHPRNKQTHGTPGVNLSQSRLLFITSAGAYVPGEQAPFDAPNVYGDYTIRRIPSATSLANLAYAHDHYDHAAIDVDARVALPLPYLQEMVDNGNIASLSPSFVSFMGYQPDSARVVDEMIPQIVRIAKEEQVQTALLAPV